MDSVLVVGRLFFSPLIAGAPLLEVLAVATADADKVPAAADVVVIMADTDDALLLVVFV